MKRILTVAQSSLPESQFLAFRRIVLNEFGKSGLEKELARILAEKHHKER
jgi:RNase P/RNase MRP subunit POP5